MTRFAPLTVHDLPTLNAGLNLASFFLLLAGYRAIRAGRILLHRRLMLSALGVSGLFLVSYVVYHAEAGSRTFPGTGLVRALYLGMLATHVVLAAAIVPMVLLTVRRALREDYGAHRRVARRTLPLWLYVSVTGVLVYLALYVVY